MDLSSYVVWAGLPLVGFYHTFCVHPFFNIAAEDAVGLEKAANFCLTPSQYLFVGKKAVPTGMGYRLEERFSYEDEALWWKTCASIAALPPSLVIGSVLKGAALLFPEARVRMQKISCSLPGSFESHNEDYRQLGIEISPQGEEERMVCQGYERRPEDVSKLKAEKEALREIVRLLEAHDILYWLDCGTCLGAYRYGGVIPWDWDVDLAILQPDFFNVWHVLSQLDPEKYVVQDWSSRDKPHTYLKVYVKETHSLIDIYHFSIDVGKQEVQTIVSNEGSIFLPESWKIRERRYVVPTPFSYIFPRKRASFDGVEVYVPRETELYLQQRYGQNIGPVKIYNALTGDYEKDLSHPYWGELYNR